jgi:hypothetical protein
MPVAAESRKGRTRGGGGGTRALELPGQEEATPSTETQAAVEPAPADELSLPGDEGATGVDLTQYLDPFKATFNQCVWAQLPQTINWFRAEAEARDPEGGQASADRSLTDFLSLLQPLVDQVIPFLIEEVTGEQRQRSSRGEPQELTREAKDRFWGALLSAVVPLVVDNLPTIVDEVSSAFSPGGIFGGRSYDRQVATELVKPPLTDHEMVARFWGPLVSVLGGALTDCLPDLFRIVQGRGRTPRDYTISWGDLSITNRLWDNDILAVVGIADIDDPNACEFVLELAWPKTWWKAIQVQDDNGSVIVEIDVHDNSRINEARVPADFILRGGYLLFMKAKMFGVHTGMYRMSTARMENLRGKRVHFLWAAD